MLASDVMGGKFPTPYTNESQAALQSGSSVTLQNDSASTQYEIQGSSKGARRGPLTATVSANTTFSNDQTNTAQDYWGLVHGAQFTTLDESLTGAGVHLVRDSQDAYTVDSGAASINPGRTFSCLRMSRKVLTKSISCGDSVPHIPVPSTRMGKVMERSNRPRRTSLRGRRLAWLCTTTPLGTNIMPLSRPGGEVM